MLDEKDTVQAVFFLVFIEVEKVYEYLDTMSIQYQYWRKKDECFNNNVLYMFSFYLYENICSTNKINSKIGN